MKIDGQTRPQTVTTLLLQVPIQKLHNILVIEPENGVIKYARDAENNIIISDYTLRSLFKPQQKKSSTIQGHRWLWMLYIRQNYIFLITIMAWSAFKKKLKYQSQNFHNRSYGEKSNCINETYKNTVMPHGCNIYSKASDMEKATMCLYPQ